jgi:NAD(P)H-hydrate epimerase
MKCASPEQMQALDRVSIEEIGIPGLVLMENAGRVTLERMEAEFGPVLGRSVCVVVGPGNNGGDGLVIARHVLQRGGRPLLLFLKKPEQLCGDAALNATICTRLQLPSWLLQTQEELPSIKEALWKNHCEFPFHSVVDALFGTGLVRKVDGLYAATVQFINTLRHEQGWPVVAVDLPSGLCGRTGLPLGTAVHADLTVTYGLPQPGHYLHGGPQVGKLVVADIGIPPRSVEEAKLPGQVLDHKELAPLLRSRPKAGHKGTFGHLLIVAGSEGKTGAALLTAQGALRSGCGLVTLAVPADLNPIFASSLPEAMTVALPNSSKYVSAADYGLITELALGKAAVVVGPGLGLNPESGPLVRWLYRDLNQPLLIDADGLNLLALDPAWLESAVGPRIFTPHPGELARLSGMSIPQIQADRLRASGWMDGTIRTPEMITVLKGAGTVVCSTQGSWAINSSGNNGMAVGGMGDVLAGFLGGLLAQGYPPWEAACLGVFLHGRAADLLAQERWQGFTASEVAATLPQALMELLTLQQQGTR